MGGSSGRSAGRAAAAVIVVALVLAAQTAPAFAGKVRAAVAANFTGAATALAQAFTAKTGHEVVLSFGSSGQLYAQITQGAPFDVFLSADQERPAALVREGLAVGESRFTYALGKLALFSTDPALVTGAETLREGKFRKLAIADPGAAPYGAAAVAAIEALGLTGALTPRLVTGTSIAQAFQFVVTGNAELGFVALSQLVEGPGDGSRWVVPQELYPPIRQDVVLLRSAADMEAARALLDFMRGEEGIALILQHGYAAVAE